MPCVPKLNVFDRVATKPGNLKLDNLTKNFKTPGIFYKYCQKTWNIFNS